MQRPEQSSIPGDSEERSLDVNAVRVHYHHLQGGLKTVRHCKLCSEGLAGLYEEAPAPVAVDKEPAVVKGDGVNEEENAPPASDSWEPTG